MYSGSREGKLKAQSRNIGFFQRLFGMGEDQPRKKAFRILKKELASAKIDVYRLKQDTISVPVAKMIYEIYKLTYPLRKQLALEKSGNRFPPSFVESFILDFHPERALDIYNKLNADSIKELVAKHGIKAASSHIENLLNEYFDLFNHSTVKKINTYYTNFLYFTRFTHFDFFPILREFDTNLEESNFLKKPSFSPAEGSLLRDDIYQLHKALYRFAVDDSIDWGIEIFTKMKNIEPISKNSLNRLKKLLQNLQNNNYLSLIIRAIDMKVTPIPVSKPQIKDIFKSFSVKKRKDTFDILNSIKTKFRNEAVSSILPQLFEGNVAERIKNYNEVKNDKFSSLGLPTFTYSTVLNFVKAFATDKYKPFISKTVNELIVSGIFIDKKILNNLSNSYYALNNILPSIDTLDDELDIDGKSGKMINRLLNSINRDRSSRKILEKTILDFNDRARLIINDEIVNIKEMALCLKKILDEYKLKSPTIVPNLRKIRQSKNREFIKDLVKTYRYIYLFLKLLSNYVSLRVTNGEKQQEEEGPQGAA